MIKQITIYELLPLLCRGFVAVHLALREFYSELRDDMLYIGRIIVSVEKQEK